MATYKCPQCGENIYPDLRSRAKEHCIRCGAEYDPFEVISSQIHQQNSGKWVAIILGFLPGMIFGCIFATILLSALFGVRQSPYSQVIFIVVMAASILINMAITSIFWRRRKSRQAGS